MLRWCLVLSAILVVVSSAPVIDKRTKEEVIVGNHQNAPRIKKSWQELHDTVPSNSDSKGFIRALDAQDLEEELERPLIQPKIDSSENSVNSVKGIETGSDVLKELGIGASDEDDSKENEVEELAPLNVETNDVPIEPETQDESSEVDEDNVVSEHDDITSNLQQLAGENMKQENKQVEEWKPYSLDMGEEGEGSGELTELDSQFQDPDFLTQLYGEAPGYFYDTYGAPYRGRRSTASKVKSSGGDREVKRSHRTKRDLGYPAYLGRLYPYRNSWDPYDEDYADPVSRYPYLYEFDDETEPEEDFEPLSYLTGDSELGVPGYNDNEDFDPLDDYNSDLDSLYRLQPRFQPAKRQSLSFMPGIRRKRFEYPHLQEPQGHWGAFVEDQKRDSYLDEYENLYKLARMLSRRQPYDDYLPELDMQRYKKK